MGWDMIDEDAWQRNKAWLSLTCWSWSGDEACQLMRLPGKEIEQTYSLLVMGWDMINETAWQNNQAVSLTRCWFMWLPDKEINQSYSLPVGHRMRMMRLPVKKLCHHPPTMGWNMIRLPGKEKCGVSHILFMGKGLFRLYYRQKIMHLLTLF